MAMSSIPEITTAIEHLSRSELAALREWFVAFDAAAWDEQFEEDVKAGRTDEMAEEASRDLRQGRCKDL